MMRVCKETLRQRIALLELIQRDDCISIKEEFQLDAYRMLLHALESEPTVFMGVFQDGRGVAYYHTAKAAVKDGADEIIPLYEDFTE